jgi:hypothetical protein
VYVKKPTKRTQRISETKTNPAMLAIYGASSSNEEHFPALVSSNFPKNNTNERVITNKMLKITNAVREIFFIDEGLA